MEFLGKRIFSSIIFFSLCAITPLLRADVELVVRNRAFFFDRDFKRIPDFFTGQEYSGSKVYHRSNPSEREGYFFVVKVNGLLPEISTDAYWRLEWISPLDPVSQTVKIPIKNLEIFGKEVFIGLTGNNWPGQSVQPLAWRLCLMEKAEVVIAKSQSFLWSK